MGSRTMGILRTRLRARHFSVEQEQPLQLDLIDDCAHCPSGRC
jgi:hypothetical protein